MSPELLKEAKRNIACFKRYSSWSGRVGGVRSDWLTSMKEEAGIGTNPRLQQSRELDSN